MLTTEFKIEDAIEVWKEEAYEDGFEEGREEGREEGIEKGIVVGREEGKEQGVKEMARKLKVATLIPIEQIALISGLSVAEVEAL